ncbi:MAG: hypothetical protein LBD72_02500 [Puniceicoccales bacterium]|nr:hypothetical protein [Puniceicoccales bacterium]
MTASIDICASAITIATGMTTVDCVTFHTSKKLFCRRWCVKWRWKRPRVDVGQLSAESSELVGTAGV